MLENGFLEVNILLRENMSQFRGETIFQRCYYQLFLEERMLVSYVPYYQFGCVILKMLVPKKAQLLAKSQYTQRKPLYFENTGSASLSKIGHDFRK